MSRFEPCMKELCWDHFLLPQHIHILLLASFVMRFCMIRWHFMLQLRKAVLAEVMSAVKLLVHCQQFNIGMAVAISSHIRHHLEPALDWQHSDERVYLEHAALLQLEPLQELLTFLWTHLSSKMQLLEPYIRAHQLLCTPVSQHPDGIDAACSSAKLHACWCCLPSHSS